MEQITLFRGITVTKNEVDEIIEDIKANGLYGTEKCWWQGFIWKNLKANLTTLFQKEDLKKEDTEIASTWIKKNGGGYRKYTEGEVSICFADKV